LVLRVVLFLREGRSGNSEKQQQGPGSDQHGILHEFSSRSIERINDSACSRAAKRARQKSISMAANSEYHRACIFPGKSRYGKLPCRALPPPRSQPRTRN
jgi:hypothetical protein